MIDMDKGCFVFSSSLRVSVRWEPLITYPDVKVVCGRLQYASGDPQRETITNPTLVAEALSKSTAKTVRGEKAFLYREMPSPREILLVEPSRVWVEHSWKLDNGNWEIETVTDLAAVVHLSSRGCDLAVSEICRQAEIFLDAK